MGLLRNDNSASEKNADVKTSQVSSGGFNAVLDRGSEFEGKLTFEGTVRIDGKFKGEIFSSARLVVGETGKIEANVTVDSISVSGEVIGDIKAITKVELHPQAVIRGNIETPKLVVEEGSIIQGQINMDTMSSASAGKNPKVGIAVNVEKETKGASTHA